MQRSHYEQRRNSGDKRPCSSEHVPSSSAACAGSRINVAWHQTHARALLQARTGPIGNLSLEPFISMLRIGWRARHAFGDQPRVELGAIVEPSEALRVAWYQLDRGCSCRLRCPLLADCDAGLLVETACKEWFGWRIGCSGSVRTTVKPTTEVAGLDVQNAMLSLALAAWACVSSPSLPS